MLVYETFIHKRRWLLLIDPARSDILRDKYAGQNWRACELTAAEMQQFPGPLIDVEVMGHTVVLAPPTPKWLPTVWFKKNLNERLRRAKRSRNHVL